MKVFLVGGTGAVGAPTLTALIAAGHEVTALARSTEKATVVAAKGARPVIASIYESGQLEPAFAGHDVVVNLATAIPPNSKFMSSKAWANNDRVRREGSTNIVDAAIAAGVGRLIQESVVMIYPDSGEQWIDESIAPDTFPLAQGNLAAEANTKRFSDAAGLGVVLRFGWFYGPGATHSEEAFALARRHLYMQLGRPDTYVSSIHMHDAAQAVVAALDVAGGIYNVVDDQPVTKREFTDALSAATRKRPWIRYPGRAALLLGDRTTSLTRSLRVSNDRFRTATGWAPTYPSVREGWLATANVLG